MDPNTTVLLAEDNENDAFLMQRAFKAHGLQRPVQVARDGTETINYLEGAGPYADRSRFPYPGLIILDLKMPGKSGFDVLAWLHGHPDLRVIPTLVWSASADAADVKRAYCLGANGYLCKPTDFQKFKEMLADVIAFWDQCLKPPPDAGPSCSTLLAETERNR